MLTVHLRVNEAGRPVPCRVRVEAGGVGRLPLGRSEGSEGVVHLSDGLHAAIDGACEVRLPPGPVSVHASRGPLYAALRADTHLAAGKMALRFEIARRADWRPRGWYAGDCRVHGLSPHGALVQGAAEDLAVVHLLAREGDRSLIAFSGDRACLEAAGTVVAVNTLNEDRVLGSASLLNAHRPVFPLTTREQPWSVFDWCGQCRRKKGLVVWPDLPRLTEERPQGEALAALIAGQIDAVEVCSRDSLALYHRLLNAGIKASLVGSSGREDATTPLGRVRTYARLAEGEPFSLAVWVEAVRAGRTFVSSGPLLEFTADGQHVRAEALFAEQVEILAGGQVIASGTSQVEAEIPPGPTWLAARCDGPEGFAHTSALWTPGAVTPRPDRLFLAALDDTACLVPRPDVLAHLDEARRSLLGGRG